MKSKQIPKTNTKKCSEVEYLIVKLFKHHSRAFVYNVWNGNNFIGEIVEDDIMRLLDKGDMNKLNKGESVFMVSLKRLRMAIIKPNYIN